MITVNNCGHDSHHSKPCNIEHAHGLPEYLLLLIKKDAWFYQNGVRTSVSPNTILLFSPNTYIHYGCDSSEYNDDWIHFFCDSSEHSFLRSLNLNFCEPMIVYDFHNLSLYIQLLSEAFHNPVLHQDQIVDSLMHAFLYALNNELIKLESNEYKHKYYQDFSQIRTHIFNDPSKHWNTAELAKSLCLSVSYFQHLYKQFFLSSCQQDIIDARIQMAQLYLKTSEMSIYAIASFCGYENELHFMRQFKKKTGSTPSEYRSTQKQTAHQ